jgi:hypothetical protein
MIIANMTPMISTIQTVLSALISELEACFSAIGKGLSLRGDENILIVLFERSLVVKRMFCARPFFDFQMHTTKTI